MSRAALKKRTTATNTRIDEPARITGNRVGRLVGWADDGAPLVEFDGSAGGVAARALANLRRSLARGSGSPGLELLLAFDRERADRPIVVGILGEGTQSASPAFEAVVDGKRVVIEGQDEIVLKCGQASITLRRNGRLVVRGTYVETRANGVNRIRGGTVEIN